MPEPRQVVQPVIVQRRMTEYEAKRIQQSAWFGNNENQIAKALNTLAKAAASGGAGLDVLPVLLSVERMVQDIKRMAQEGAL